MTPPGKAWPGYTDVGASEEAPQISAISETTMPGETLIITGGGLDGATLVFSRGEGPDDLSPLRSADDRMQAVLPESSDPAARGVVLLWPVKQGLSGRPIRVNAPAAHWVWPCRYPADAEAGPLRVFGRNLSLQDVAPEVYIQGPDDVVRSVAVAERSAYSFSLNVPEGLAPGAYRLWVHNGTGGRYGWSDPVVFNVLPPMARADVQVRVDSYMAEAGDASEAIDAAIRDVQRRGGGVVRFGVGRYELSKPLKVSPGPHVILQGEGGVSWDLDAGKPGDEPGTVLIAQPGAVGRDLIELFADGSGVRGLMLVDEVPGRHSVIVLAGKNQQVRDAWVVRLLDDPQAAAVECRSPGDANQQVIDVSFDVFGRSVRITRGTHYVRIADCLMRGHFSHGKGTESNAVTNWGGNQMIMERCEVRSADRAGGKVVGRTCLLYRHSIRNCYLSGNRSVSVGSHSNVPGMLTNLSEQYLFHSQGEMAGVFEVEQGDGDGLRVQGDTPGQVRGGGDWIAFIARGVGVGQWRVIRSVQADGRIEVEKPWRIIPGPGSVVILQPVFRQNIVVGNTIDPAPDPAEADPAHKTVGVYLFHLCFDNIVASNTIRNTGVGVSIAADADTPSAWNLVRDNVMVNMTGSPGDAASGPMAFCEYSRGLFPPQRAAVKQWLSVGNQFRDNSIEGAPTLAAVSWRDFDRQHDLDYKPGTDRGLVMTVIECNRLNGIRRGVMIGAPANWTLIRSNETAAGDRDLIAATKIRARVVEPRVMP